MYNDLFSELHCQTLYGSLGWLLVVDSLGKERGPHCMTWPLINLFFVHNASGIKLAVPAEI